jgi:hypothetical protein
VETGRSPKRLQWLASPRAVVSQQVTNLEQEEGNAFDPIHLERNSAKSGPRILPALSSHHQKAEDAFNLLSQSTEIPTGTLRIAAPLGLRHNLTPVVTAVRRAYLAASR